MRTKARFIGTNRRARRESSSVRPFALYFLGFVATAGSLLPSRECGPEWPAPVSPTLAPVAVSTPVATPAPDLFVSSVRPVLASRCSPCHEPGGKMYEKLPFDHADVVQAHSAGVLRRLKGEDREAVEKWLASLPPTAD